MNKEKTKKEKSIEDKCKFSIFEIMKERFGFIRSQSLFRSKIQKFKKKAGANSIKSLWNFAGVVSMFLAIGKEVKNLFNSEYVRKIWERVKSFFSYPFDLLVKVVLGQLIILKYFFKGLGKILKVTFFQIVPFVGIIVIFVIVGSGAVLSRYTANLPSIAQFEKLENAESTKIYDRTGEVLLYEIFAEEKKDYCRFG